MALNEQVLGGGGAIATGILGGTIDGVGPYTFLVVNADGSINVTTVAATGITPVVSAAAEGSHVLKGSPGILQGIDFTSGALSGFLMLFDAISAPADGAVTPAKCWPINANSFISVSFLPRPLNFLTGITAVFSTTGPFTKTISATGFFSAEVV